MTTARTIIEDESAKEFLRRQRHKHKWIVVVSWAYTDDDLATDYVTDGGADYFNNVETKADLFTGNRKLAHEYADKIQAQRHARLLAASLDPAGSG